MIKGTVLLSQASRAADGTTRRNAALAAFEQARRSNPVSYSAVVEAVARGGALQGALAMVVFGVATVPALLGVSVADGLLGARQRMLLNRLAQLFILAMGCRFLWRVLAG